MMPDDGSMFWPRRQVESPDSLPDEDPLQDRTCVLAAHRLLSLANANQQPVGLSLPLQHGGRSEYMRELEFARVQPFAANFAHWHQNRLLMI